MTVTMRQLQYFVVCAELGTMSAAAQELHVSQSAISLGVAQLEARLEVDLLVRNHARRLQLTPAGRELLVEARQLLSDMNEMIDRTRAQSRTASGRLTVGCYQTLGPMLLPPVVEGFEAARPDVELHVREGGAADLCEALTSGELETAMLYDLDVIDGVTSFPLTTVRPYVLLSPNHPLAAHETLSVAQLQHEDMILYNPPGDYYLGLLKEHNAAPRVRYRFDNYETVRSFAARGLGYTLLHQRQSIEASYEGRPLTVRELREDLPTLQVVLCVRQNARLTARTRAFIEFTRAMFHTAHHTAADDQLSGGC
ncbi:LysR family transcriptional regulator [Nonomuraea sp. NPDC059023]|uniref:LysR family transcriptional regulator n=1 Tax=unclassified Nonomuraea TaxID=2593643 RepID=UPI003675CE9F